MVDCLLTLAHRKQKTLSENQHNLKESKIQNIELCTRLKIHLKDCQGKCPGIAYFYSDTNYCSELVYLILRKLFILFFCNDL